jgi:ADP-ribose pyrophosphatase
MEVKVNDKKRIHQGRVFELYSENLTTDQGKTFSVEVIRHPGAAAIVPVDADDTVLLLSQYRHAVGGRIWEIPAGTLDPGETPEVCARRELVEETGFSANTWQKLSEITPVPGYSDERIHLYLATDLHAAEQSLDENEILDVHRFSFNDAVDMVHTGRSQDAKSICGLLLAARAMEKSG